MAVDPANEREKWNRRYRTQGCESLGLEPTPWLADHRDLLVHPRDGAAARALDLACGNGKNTFYLAELGYHVDAVDISDVAVEHVRREAQRRRADDFVTVRREDLRSALLPVSVYDVVVCCRYLERRLFPAIEEALRPGGVAVVETFTRQDPEISGRSFPAELLLDEGELARSLPRLETLASREAVVEYPERGRRALAGLVGRKPATSSSSA